MDYNQKDFFQFPYPYMYPLQGLYMMGNDSERALEYLQQMYPAEAREMQHLVEEECDRLEYEGSMMYDEYPDRVSMLFLCDKLQNKCEQPVDQAKRSLLEVLLYNEMYRRRCRYRRCRRFW